MLRKKEVDLYDVYEIPCFGTLPGDGMLEDIIDCSIRVLVDATSTEVQEALNIKTPPSSLARRRTLVNRKYIVVKVTSIRDVEYERNLVFRERWDIARFLSGAKIPGYKYMLGKNKKIVLKDGKEAAYIDFSDGDPKLYIGGQLWEE